MHETKRYLGLELAGAKNHKTALATLEFYPKERKIFLLDIFDKIAGHEDQTGDQALLELITELNSNVAHLGVNVPLELPPCILCSRKACASTRHCSLPQVKWMRDFSRKQMDSEKSQRTGRRRRPIEFTAYTQRPVELWVRYEIMPQLEETSRFEVDEALGGNRAPLTARMHYLKRSLEKISLVEVWPKLTVAVLGSQLGLHRRITSSYRQLEDGVHSREEFLTQLARTHQIFIYERDMVKLSQSLTAFDAFICAFTAWLSDENQCAKIPKGFPVSSGWVHYPKLPS